MIVTPRSLRRNVPRVIRNPAQGAPLLYDSKGRAIRERDKGEEQVEMFHFVGDEESVSEILSKRGGRGMQALMSDLRDAAVGRRTHSDKHYAATTATNAMEFERNNDSMIEFHQRVG